MNKQIKIMISLIHQTTVFSFNKITKQAPRNQKRTGDPRLPWLYNPAVSPSELSLACFDSPNPANSTALCECALFIDSKVKG